MKPLPWLPRVCASFSLLWCALALADENPNRTATLYRDTWGVPHIYADSEAAGAFALGYAQAEDRLGDVHAAVRTGMGRMSEAFGPEHVEQDYVMRLWRNAELAQSRWEELPENLREMATAFVQGVEAYQEAHPDKVPEFAMELQPWMLLTVGRAMILRWPIGTILDDMKGKPQSADRPPPAQQSNQWAVAPERSADKIPILLTDPHLTWESLAVLYEARVHAGDLHMNGFFVIGSPLVGIGHNQQVGWAMTTGGPDTSDVYEMKIRPFPKPQYEYDGEWRDAELRMIEVPVKDADPVKRPAFYTHLGPVMAEPDLAKGTALVGASPYFDQQIGLFQQQYQMAMATDVYEVFEALGMNHLNEQNLMFADTSGNIGYLRSGATPIRPEGYDWDAPVPGHTSATAWKGLHPAKDLVHIFNPASGYMQNCNISPKNMMVDSPLTADKYPEYIYNTSWDQNNPRGQRTTDLLHQDTSVTTEEAIAYAMDVHDILADTWQSELQAAAAANPPQDEELQAVIDAILAWDDRFTADATATCVYKFWRLRCGRELDVSPLGKGQPLTAETRQKMIELLGQTVAEMKDTYGKWDVPWGEIHKVGRGEQLYPVGGTDFSSGDKQANFSETLFDVRSVPHPDHPGQYVANSGSMAMLLMFFHEDGIRSYTCIPWGQSADPQSPHYMDQGRELYSKRQMKPTWWTKQELLPNVESTTELMLPAP